MSVTILKTASSQPLAPFELVEPAEQTLPLVFSSPHSGRNYPAEFIAASRLDALTIRRSEDSFVDEIFAAAPDLGAPLLKALFPRAYCDPNREAFELDPDMFSDPLPLEANTDSPRVAGGLGTIARVVSNGLEIYRRKLTFADAKRRIDTLYHPYHAALSRLLEQTKARFGYAVLIDCHSMPSVAGPTDRDKGARRADIVLGDRYGSSCAPFISGAAESLLTELGHKVALNIPYAGGYTTEHYGDPASNIHALQIEINRATYMDEKSMERLPGLAALGDDMARLVERLGAAVAAHFPQ